VTPVALLERRWNGGDAVTRIAATSLPPTVRVDHVASLNFRNHLEADKGRDRSRRITAVSRIPGTGRLWGSPKDTKLVNFVFARTTRESVGHKRTRHGHGSRA